MTAAVTAASITAWSLHLPGVDLEPVLAERGVAVPDGQLAVPPERAAEVLGRRGMLYKEPATRLALCAVHRALRVPLGKRPGFEPDPSTAVVVASNLGNVEAVARVTSTVRDEGGSAVSVLDAPNASSNIVASTIALWFGFGAANLMICSGDGAGFDGLELAVLLLRARRAERVVLVGVEPEDPVAAGLYAGSGRLRAGAACLVLEPPGKPQSVDRQLSLTLSDGKDPDLTVGPDGDLDPARHWGDFYGAQDVIALALAAELAAGGQRSVGVRSTGRPRRAVVAGAQR